MPYIKNEARLLFDTNIKLLVENIEEDGELCYCIYRMLNDLTIKKGKKFKTMSSLISELECAKLEFYRRIVSPYEDIKITENGDII
jgi:hypothetical protein